MARLEVRLLGGYRVDLNGERAYGFETDKARALLAYLMVERNRPHRRETLASLLWPDRPDAVARANLRQTLARLRRALRDAGEPRFLFVTPHGLQFNAASDYLLDVAELEAYGRSPARHAQLLPSALCSDFLAGFAIPDSEAFQAWLLNEQEYCHRLVIDILEEQCSHWEEVGAYEQAAAAGAQMIQVEPWLEEAHRRCMRDLALAGRREEALHRYDLCRGALQAELGAEPGPSTQALYVDIRDGAPVSVVGRDRLACSRHTSEPVARFVAREAECGQLSLHLVSALRGEGRVVLVSGEVGSGKSALLEAFAAAAMAENPDLLVAGVRCYPGGSADPNAPLRRLGEILFGDLDSDSTWWIPDSDQASRLRQVSEDALTALVDCGCDLIHSFLPARSIRRRFEALPARSAGSAKMPDWDEGLKAATWPGGPRSLARPGPASPDNPQDQLICALAALSRKHPLLLLFDDLQWVDESTASFLFRLSKDLVGCPVLALGAYRPTAVAIGQTVPHSSERVRHPLARMINELRLHAGEIVIDLDRADGKALLEALVDMEPNRLGAPFRDALLAHTDGHALFTVETLRNLQEREVLFKDEAGRWVARDDLDWGALPVRVEAAIAERIDRLPAVSHRILSIASVQGDAFSAELVAELAHSAVADVVACLSGSLAREHRLVLPGTVHVVHGVRRSVYRFAHHLFGKYLYDQLDPIQRGQLHRQVAAVLARQVEDDAVEREQLSAQLAWHYECAGMRLEAAQTLYQAGRRAMSLSAFREAIQRFEQGLALLHGEPATPERARLEQQLVLGLLSPQRSLKGWEIAGYQSNLARARQIGAGEMDSRQGLLLVLAEMERLMVQGHYAEALASVDRARAAAQASGDLTLLPILLANAGTIHCLLGQLQTGLPLLESVLAWQTAERCAELRQWNGWDLGVIAMTWSGAAYWLTGYGERGIARCQAAVNAAQERSDPLGLAFALAYSLVLQVLSGGKPAEAEPHVARLRQLALDNGFEWWRVFAEILAGRLMLDRGEISGGIELCGATVAAWQGSGMQMGLPILVALIAGGCLRARQRLPAGQQAARERLLGAGSASLEMVSHLPGLRDGWIAPELNRLRGELLFARDGEAAAPEALGRFRTAVRLAQQHGTLVWELRAALSTVRLLRAIRGEGDAELIAALDHLRLVYGMFTEGWSGPPDLQEAAMRLGTAEGTPESGVAPMPASITVPG